MRYEKWKEFLQKSAKEIDNELESFFTTWNKEISQISPHLLPLTKAFSEANQAGKRIRGSLVLLGYALISEKDKSKDLLTIASAYEIFQTAILAHDDIIDNSPRRRGKPSLHMKLG